MLKSVYEYHNAIRNNKKEPVGCRSGGGGKRDSICNWHRNIEIIFTLEGQGTVKCGATEYEAEAGDIVVINANRIHRVNGTEGFRFLCLIVDEVFCADNGIDVENICFREKFRDESIGALCQKVEQLMREEKEESSFRVARLRCTLLQLLVEMCLRFVDGEARTVAEDIGTGHVKRALSYLYERYTQPVNLDEMAKWVGISKGYLSREFRKCTGQSIVEYVNRMRCQRAEMCISEGMSMTETAMECGFSSLSYFSRTYKKCMGRAPFRGRAEGTGKR